MTDNQLILINQPDDKPSYFSRAWKISSIPDLAIATEDIEKRTTRTVNSQLGGSDHLPITLSIADMKTILEYHRKKASWNFKKAKWNKYQLHAESLRNTIFTEDINHNVKELTQAILTAARRSIPRGFRKDYKPYWSQRLACLHQRLSEARESMEQSPSAETTAMHNQLKEDFDKTKTQEQKQSWQNITSPIGFDSDTGKLWRLTKILNEDSMATRGPTVLEEGGTFHTG